MCVYTTMYVFMFKYMWAHINNNGGHGYHQISLQRRRREEEDRMWIAVAMWEINSKHWGQETEAEATKQIKFVLEALCGFFIRPFHIYVWQFPGGFQYSSKKTEKLRNQET